jgi:Flp pilus assembly protein TadG
MRRPSFVRLTQLLRRFPRDRRGVAAVEFAFVLPLMVLLYLGCVATTMAVTTDRKLTLLARSLGDIVAQDTAITAAEMGDVWNAARAVMTPYSSALTILSMRVSSIKIKADGKACVEWSDSPNSAFKRVAGADVTTFVPADLRIPSSYLIVSEVEYKYDPVVGDDITGGIITLKDKLFLRPRQSTQVTHYNQPNPSLCPG